MIIWALNFYFFMIGSDGYAGIGKFMHGEQELLSHETLLPTDAPPETVSLQGLSGGCQRETVSR